MTSSNAQSFKQRVCVARAGACDAFILPTPIDGVVSFRGSFAACPDFAAGEDLVMDLTASLLDKGTRHRDRFEVAALLEDRGAELSFGTDGERIVFYGRTLRRDMPGVLRLLAEQLREPLFDDDEFAKARQTLEASLQRSRENTGAQAAGALARALYEPAHPNYVPPVEEDLARLGRLTVDEVRAFHRQHFGASDLVFVLVGDVDAAPVTGLLEETLGDWRPHELPDRAASRARPPAGGQTLLALPDKNNVDVRMGHGLPIRRQDDAFLPLFVANYILGGNFSARLMSTVRDKMGLTYGISSSLNGITTRHEGHWQVAVTLSKENLERGLEATRAEVRRFVEEGVTEGELEEKQTTIVGGHQVTLSSTAGQADVLHRNAVRRFDVAYLDTFPEEVRTVTLAQVNEAIRDYFMPDRFHEALAGMLPESVRPTG